MPRTLGDAIELRGGVLSSGLPLSSYATLGWEKRNLAASTDHCVVYSVRTFLFNPCETPTRGAVFCFEDKEAETQSEYVSFSKLTSVTCKERDRCRGSRGLRGSLCGPAWKNGLGSGHRVDTGQCLEAPLTSTSPVDLNVTWGVETKNSVKFCNHWRASRPKDALV